MTDDFNTPVCDLPGHAETRDTIADHVAGSPHPKLAAASILVAAFSIALTYNGREWMEGVLKAWLKELPDFDQDVRNTCRESRDDLH